MVQSTEKKNDWYVSNFEMLEKSLNGESGSHIHAVRRAAIARLNDLGFPTTHDEEWKYTNVGPIAKANFKPVLRYEHGVTGRQIERFSFGGLTCSRLVFVNGHYAGELSSVAPLPQEIGRASCRERV